MNLTELAEDIRAECHTHRIIYDDTTLPIKFGPDCYIFYGTPLSHECEKHGQCKQLTYYAMVGGKSISIVEKSKL